ncbi:DUF3857 domain-containing protein [Psychroflexus aestuariivivens]|uniref:DUF3857 domain-containing protein n=1 Tax=Psychroflexus aestuariivivens TaxID=1795040 RepID=UPI000FD991A2|nr:DUF3857 domain-containing protein [Psychroflexus aestuariivivens]
MKKLLVLTFLLGYISFSQGDAKELVASIGLMDNANSLVLNHETVIEITSYDDMRITESKEILVLNKKGFSDIGAFEPYDAVTKVKNIEAIIYDSNGNEIEKFKKRHFKDVSAVSNGTMYSDSRVYYLDYTPIKYPIKVKYSSEIKTKNTAFIRSFRPISNYYQSVKSYSFKIINTSDSELRIHKNEYVTEDVSEDIKSNPKTFTFTAKNLKAIQTEPYSPSLENFTPKIMFALSKFELEGVTGEATNWSSFGQWQNENLLSGVNNLPESTIKTIQDLVANLETVEDKARLVYEYVQNNTRYISLQIGIGGWKPISAEMVDDTQYGDCKGLTNYTKSLLEAVGIPSNYCVVQSGSEISDLEADFASMQGDHVILNIPQDNSEGYWMECTDQKIPFNFLGSFTDNRNVLAIGNQGSEIIKTPAYIEDDNHQSTYAKIDISGIDIIAEVEIVTKGTQYQSHYFLADADDKRIQKHYNNYWSHLKRLNLKQYQFNNNKKEVQFSENLNIEVQNYIKQYGNDLIFEVNPFNKISFNLSNSKERENPFLVSRGFVVEDVFEFHIGEMTVETIPEDIILESKFGIYKLNFQIKDNTFLVKRYIKLNKNNYEKSDYSNFVEFTKQIETYDQIKASFKS